MRGKIAAGIAFISALCLAAQPFPGMGPGPMMGPGGPGGPFGPGGPMMGMGGPMGFDEMGVEAENFGMNIANVRLPFCVSSHARLACRLA